jgi:hypothetical protein
MHCKTALPSAGGCFASGRTAVRSGAVTTPSPGRQLGLLGLLRRQLLLRLQLSESLAPVSRVGSSDTGPGAACPECLPASGWSRMSACVGLVDCCRKLGKVRHSTPGSVRRTFDRHSPSSGPQMYPLLWIIPCRIATPVATLWRHSVGNSGQSAWVSGNKAPRRRWD